MKETSAEIVPKVENEELAIEVTTRCNSSCLHCFVRSGMSRHTSLPVDLVKQIMVEGYDVGYRQLHITGGEPLLWKGLFEVIDYGFGVGYQTIFMNTNGTLITEENSKRLAGYDKFSMSISLDGPKDQHERLRGKGSHSRAMQGIETALNGGNDVTVFTTVTKSLLPGLPLFVNDLYKEFPNIDGLILIQLLRVTNGAFPLSDELLDSEDFIRLVRMVAFLNVGGFRAIVKKNPVANIVSKLMNMPWIPIVPPLYRKGGMIVMANRSIGVVHSNRNSLGRYRAGMIRNVLSSEGYRAAVSPDEAKCPFCKYVRLCRENGMIHPLQGYTDLYTDSPFCRKVLDKIALFQDVLKGTTDGQDFFAC